MPKLDFNLPRERNNNVVHDPLSMYKLSDEDITTDPAYYGYLAHNGAYYIQKYSPGVYARYYAGKGDYSTQWASRVSLPYDTFDDIF